MLPRMADPLATYPNAVAIATAVKRGEVTARAVVDAALERAETVQRDTNAFTHLLHERARAAADALDAQATDRPLAGVPFAVKANICVQGVPTTAGSDILADFVPPYDATVIARLEAAGAIPIAMTNLDAFGMGGSSEASAHGPVHNPRDPSRVPGGSSGGAAAAVAAGVVPFALGTDTGGSVRQPAAFCGVTGFKPTYGTLSRYGVIAYASSLDQVGILANDAGDVAAVLDAMVGHDPHDATTVQVEPTFHAALEEAASPEAPLAGVTIGVIRELLGEGNAPAVLDAVERTRMRLQELGADVREVSIPSARAALAAYYLIASAEASSNLARFDGMITGKRVGANGDGQADVMTQSRGAGFNLEVRRRILMGTFALSAGHVDAWYGRALQVRRKVADELSHVFGEVDALLAPTAPSSAYPLGAKVDDPLAMYLGDVDTVLANLSGVGAISVPAGTDEAGLPVGVQLLTPALHDARLLQLARALQD